MLPVIGLALGPVPAFGQDPPSTTDAAGFRDMVADSFLPNLWDLAVQGGWFMVPIAIASIVTLAFAFERIVGLRRARIMPTRLLRRIRKLTRSASQSPDPKLDLKKVWEACEASRSPLSRVLKVAVLKTGRPVAEVEKSVEDAVRRETSKMTRNLRPINVVASISPLLGLLGTVQGMIMAFMVTSTTTSTGTAKAQELAHGIYTALVTTFAGLSVAVISVVMANYLEGRIEKRLRQLETWFLEFMPFLNRYEGHVRISETLTESGGLNVKRLVDNEQRTGKRQSTRPGPDEFEDQKSAKRKAVATAVSAQTEENGDGQHSLWSVIPPKG